MWRLHFNVLFTRWQRTMVFIFQCLLSTCHASGGENMDRLVWNVVWILFEWVAWPLRFCFRHCGSSVRRTNMLTLLTLLARLSLQQGHEEIYEWEVFHVAHADSLWISCAMLPSSRKTQKFNGILLPNDIVQVYLMQCVFNLNQAHGFGGLMRVLAPLNTCKSESRQNLEDWVTNSQRREWDQNENTSANACSLRTFYMKSRKIWGSQITRLMRMY